MDFSSGTIVCENSCEWRNLCAPRAYLQQPTGDSSQHNAALGNTKIILEFSFYLLIIIFYELLTPC